MEHGFCQYSEAWGSQVDKGFDIVHIYYKLEGENIIISNEYPIPRKKSRRFS